MVDASSLPRRADVVVVGAGPAGLASAIAIRRAGLDVLVVDRAAAAPDKACGEGLMPNAVAALSRLGVRLPREECGVFRGIRFIENGRVASGHFSQGSGVGLRRTSLSRLLLEHAGRLGIDVVWSVTAAISPAGMLSLDGRRIDCRWVVAADGVHSPLRRSLKLDTVCESRRRTAVRQHYAIRPWTDMVEVHWAADCQAYVTPLADDVVCVALVSDGAAPDFARVPQIFPDLAARLASAHSVGKVRGAISLSRRFDTVRRGRVVFVGDASGSIDAITGEGMALAFRQAENLGSALASGDLAAYERAHRGLAAVPLMMSRVLLFLARHALLRRAAFGLLQAQPWLFSCLLNAHVADRMPGRAARGAASLATQEAAVVSERL